MARTTDERLDYLMEQLEKGTQNIFESGRYAEYLAVMSKFHHYSFRNTILIFLQNPNASHVAGFHAWKKDFSRSVKAGEHAVRALGTQVRRAVKCQQLGAQGGLTSGVAHGKVREGVALRGEAELPLAHEEREQSVRALRLDSAEKPLTQLRRADAVCAAQAE